jgi:hypothetical protein
MEKIEIQKFSYRTICNETEIDRIFNIKNGADHLLKIRAVVVK